MKTNIIEMLESLQSAADATGRPYVIDDGATDWDPDNLIEAVAESLDDEDDENDPEEEWGFSENASSGLALAKYDAEGYLDSVPVYRVRFLDGKEGA